MKFSILVPVYNVEKYLEDCINSILEQTVQDFELILIDDGSTDQSGNICDCFAHQNPEKIFVVHKKNEGLLLTRRKGFECARGDYVLCVDSDDRIHSQLLEYLQKAMLLNPDVICFDYCTISEKDDYIATYTAFPNITQIEVLPNETIYATLMSSYRINTIWSKAIKRSVIDVQTDYKKYDQLKYGEDVLQLLPIFTKAKIVTYVPEVLYYYRQSQVGMTRKYKRSFCDDMRLLYLEMEKKAKNEWNMQTHLKEFYTHVLRMVQEDVCQAIQYADILSTKFFIEKLRAIRKDFLFKNAYKNSCPRKSTTIVLLKWFWLALMIPFFREKGFKLKRR